MTPIKGLTEQRRLPRLGKIRLGIKKKSERTGNEYPSATDYFVCPPEVQEVYGPKPKRLEIIIPVEDDELWASQYYRQYSRTRGLTCKGDGETCRRMIDRATGAVANRDTKNGNVAWEEGLPCEGKVCSYYQQKACQEVMNLQFLLPRVKGLGIWQIDTGSINSIRNINSCAAMIRAVCDRVSWIPLVLSLEPTEVVNPDDGKKKVVHCLNLRHEAGLAELLSTSHKPKAELLIAAPAEDEEPEDKTTEVEPEPEDPFITELWQKQDEPIPQTLPELLTWVAKHGRQFTPSWMYREVGKQSSDLQTPEAVKMAWLELKDIHQW